MKKKILLFVHISTHFREIIRVAEFLQQTSQYIPIVLFNTRYANVESDISLLKKAKIRYLITDTYQIDNNNEEQLLYNSALLPIEPPKNIKSYFDCISELF